MKHLLLQRLDEICQSKKMVSVGLVMPKDAGIFRQMVDDLERKATAGRTIYFYNTFFCDGNEYSDLCDYLQELIDRKYDTVCSIGPLTNLFVRKYLVESNNEDAILHVPWVHETQRALADQLDKILKEEK